MTYAGRKVGIPAGSVLLSNTEKVWNKSGPGMGNKVEPRQL